MDSPTHKPQLAHNVTRLSHLDLPGAGQVYVDGNYAYIGHIPNEQQLGTSIIDVSDPQQAARRVADHARGSEFAQPQGARDRRHHDREQRAQHDRHRPQGRRAAETARAVARRRSDASATHAELAAEARRASRPTSRQSRRRKRIRTINGGFKIYDVADRTQAEADHFQKTDGIGVHRFDMDANYAYISTEMAGLHRQHPRDLRHPQSGEARGSVALVAAGTARRRRRKADLARTPASPASRAARSATACGPAAGTAACASSMLPTSASRAPSAHTTITRRFPNLRIRSWACRFRSPAARLRSQSTKKTTHTAREEMERRRGRPHGCMWVFDVTDPAHIQPLVDLRSERARFAVEPRNARPLRRAPVPGAHERRHARLLRLVRGRPAHRRRRRPACAAGSGLLHSRAREGQGRRRRPTMSTSTSAGLFTSSTAMRASTSSNSSVQIKHMSRR